MLTVLLVYLLRAYCIACMPTACLLRAYVAYGLTACSIELSVELIVEMRARQLYIISHARACCLRACVPRGRENSAQAWHRRGVGVASKIRKTLLLPQSLVHREDF